MTLLRRLSALVLAVSLLIAAGARAAETTPENAAQQALAVWLPLWDAGKYDESYERLAERARTGVSKNGWFEYWTAVRKPLGQVKSRRLLEVKHVVTEKADQESAMIQYETVFENKERVVETFGMLRERDGTWHVANYTIS